MYDGIFYILAVFLTAVPAGILLVMHSDFIYGNINAVSRIEFGIGNKLPVFDLVAVFFAFGFIFLKMSDKQPLSKAAKE